MKKIDINKIVSNYLTSGEDFCISSIHCSNKLYKIETDGNKTLMIKCFESESNFIREKIAFKLLVSNNIKIPTMLGSGELASKYWILYEFVKGVSLYSLIIENNTNCNLFYDIGCNLAKVHTIDFNSLFSYNEMKYYINKRYEKFITGAEVYKHKLIKEYPVSTKIFEMAHKIINSKKSLFLERDDFRFIICDFSSSNIIVDDHYDLAAFIDFEHFMFENRYRDFVSIYDYILIDRLNMESFFKGYSKIISKNEFVMSYDKLILFLLHYRLENCVIANKETIQNSVEQLAEIMKFTNSNA